MYFGSCTVFCTAMGQHNIVDGRLAPTSSWFIRFNLQLYTPLLSVRVGINKSSHFSHRTLHGLQQRA